VHPRAYPPKEGTPKKKKYPEGVFFPKRFFQQSWKNLFEKISLREIFYEPKA